MGSPHQPVTVTPDQIEQLSRKLSDLRHNVNNNLALVVAAVELIRRKPELAAKTLDTLADQPQKIMEEIRRFSVELEQLLGLPNE